AKLREQMRVELVRLQHDVGITSIYVTHDQSEALVMSDRVVVMNGGVIQQIGDPRTIYARPANAFVASFLGAANLLEGTLAGRNGARCEIDIPLGPAQPSLRLRAAGAEGAVRGQRITLSVRPEDIALHLKRPDRAMNVIEGEVIDTVYLGSFLDGQVRVGAHELSVQIDHYEQLVPGQKVFLSFEPDHGLCLTS
ncbi:MAG: ABC transporter ATP-binding protein, partial [Actinomycetota bacterium]